MSEPKRWTTRDITEADPDEVGWGEGWEDIEWVAAEDYDRLNEQNEAWERAWTTANGERDEARALTTQLAEALREAEGTLTRALGLKSSYDMDVHGTTIHLVGNLQAREMLARGGRACPCCSGCVRCKGEDVRSISEVEAEAREAFARRDGFWNGAMAGIVAAGALILLILAAQVLL
jgi:hypothetical protein